MKCTGSVNLMKCTGSVVLDFGDQSVARMFLGTGPPRKIISRFVHKQMEILVT